MPLKTIMVRHSSIPVNLDKEVSEVVEDFVMEDRSRNNKERIPDEILKMTKEICFLRFQRLATGKKMDHEILNPKTIRIRTDQENCPSIQVRPSLQNERGQIMLGKGVTAMENLEVQGIKTLEEAVVRIIPELGILIIREAIIIPGKVNTEKEMTTIVEKGTEIEELIQETEKGN